MAEEADEATQGARTPVVEDETLIRLDIRRDSEGAGYEVVGQAGDGEQAIALADDCNPELIVMYVKMPGMDGITAAHRILEMHNCAIVMLTAFSQSELVDRARDAGAMAYVVEPFTPAELIPAVEIAVSRAKEMVALKDEVANLTEQFETRKRVDRARACSKKRMGLSEPEAFLWIEKTFDGSPAHHARSGRRRYRAGWPRRLTYEHVGHSANGCEFTGFVPDFHLRADGGTGLGQYGGGSCYKPFLCSA